MSPPERRVQDQANALDKAQELAEVLEHCLDEAEDLVGLLSERVGDPPRGAGQGEWPSRLAGWGPSMVEGLGLGATITGTLVALGVGSPVAVVLGTVIGLLAFSRPRRA